MSFGGTSVAGASVAGTAALALPSGVSFVSTNPELYISQFQITVTMVICLSLILTGAIQVSFTRFISDRLFENNIAVVMPSYHGVMLAVTAGSGVIALPVVLLGFAGQTLFYKLLLLALFVITCNIWIATIFLSGLRQYRAIVILFAIGYGISVTCALSLKPFKLEGLVLGFTIGQLVLLIGMVALILRSFPARQFLSFDYFDRHKYRFYPTLALAGFFYNAAAWIDKLVFWNHAETSHQVIGFFRASLVYDLPVFITHMSMIPGLAVFLMRLETDFVEHYSKFFDAVRDGGSLEQLEELRNEMTESARQGVFDILKVQAVVGLVLAVIAPWLLDQMDASPAYLPTLYILLIAAGLQTALLGILNILLYLDRRRVVVVLVATLFVLNLVLTYVSIGLGPKFYGFGLAASLVIVCVMGFYLLDRKLDRLEYEVYMLQ
jgi:polysaccharide biosynthesis protein PelG